MADRLDEFQRRHPDADFPLAVLYQYFDDNGGNLAALIAYYAFISARPHIARSARPHQDGQLLSIDGWERDAEVGQAVQTPIGDQDVAPPRALQQVVSQLPIYSRCQIIGYRAIATAPVPTPPPGGLRV